ncbi:MAG: insulinase family protein [Nitriliruptoraceae bacterium]|nr:insulinase family protein [Nitriliruptoraceae bacterium]
MSDVPPYELSTLSSGVTVVTDPMPAVRSATLGMWISVGSRDEDPTQLGASHFLEHLLFKGTSTRSALDIAQALDAVGGEMNAFTSKELTCFYARTLDRDLPLAFEVLADMVVDARNTAEDVEAERQVVLSEIDIHLDTPDDLVHSEFAEARYGTHPLGLETLGSVDSITAMDRDTIHAYYLDRYRPEQLVVAAAGAVDHDEVVRLADQLLGDLGRPGRSRPPRVAPPAVERPDVRVRHRPTEQAHVVIGTDGVAADDPDRWPLRVLNVLLGGGMSSRLFQEIRESRGLAYTTYSYGSSYADGGSMAAYVGTSPGKLDETLKVLRAELDRVADDVSAEEVTRAKGALAGGTVLGLEDTGSRMSRIGKQVAMGVPIVTVDDALAAIDAVELDDVRAVAHRVLDRPRVAAVVGPYTPDEVERFRPLVA